MGLVLFGCNMPNENISDVTSVNDDIDTIVVETTYLGTQDNEELQSLISSVENSEEYNSLDADICAQLYGHRTSCENIPEIEGEWHRTNVHSTNPSDLTITNITNDGFDYQVAALSGGNMGSIDEYAYFVTDTLAVAPMGDEEYVENDPNIEISMYMVFCIDDDGIRIFASESAGFFNMGHGVTIGGEYITGEPVYLNADVMNETYTQEQLDYLMEELPSEYYEIFETTTLNGYIEVTVDGDSKQILAFVRGVANYYGYEMLIDGDEIVAITFADETEFVF